RFPPVLWIDRRGLEVDRGSFNASCLPLFPIRKQVGLASKKAPPALHALIGFSAVDDDCAIGVVIELHAVGFDGCAREISTFLTRVIHAWIENCLFLGLVVANKDECQKRHGAQAKVKSHRSSHSKLPSSRSMALNY